jgi:hypothetical protein
MPIAFGKKKISRLYLEYSSKTGGAGELLEVDAPTQLPSASEATSMKTLLAGKRIGDA